ncbi:hypothetical protein GCM10020000_02520 [Streptomyces olivoverticillatus]
MKLVSNSSMGTNRAALGRVVDVHAPAAEAAPHAVVDDVVVELPEEDGRGGAYSGERRQVHLHALGLEAVTAGGFEEVAGTGAVAGDAAGDAELFQGGTKRP